MTKYLLFKLTWHDQVDVLNSEDGVNYCCTHSIVLSEKMKRQVWKKPMFQTPKTIEEHIKIYCSTFGERIKPTIYDDFNDIIAEHLEFFL